eukprot:5141781-Prymnesium_polylepis.2
MRRQWQVTVQHHAVRFHGGGGRVREGEGSDLLGSTHIEAVKEIEVLLIRLGDQLERLRRHA